MCQTKTRTLRTTEELQALDASRTGEEMVVECDICLRVTDLDGYGALWLCEGCTPKMGVCEDCDKVALRASLTDLDMGETCPCCVRDKYNACPVCNDLVRVGGVCPSC